MVSTVATERNYAGLAATVAENLADEVFCTRLVRRAVQHLSTLTDEEAVARFHAAAGSTGSRQWDALIAGLAAYTWALAGHVEPLAWTQTVGALDEWWEPGGGPAKWRAWNLVHTPASLRVRRVLFPRQWLQAV